jgi:hypothetical protein
MGKSTINGHFQKLAILVYQRVTGLQTNQWSTKHRGKQIQPLIFL